MNANWSMAVSVLGAGLGTGLVGALILRGDRRAKPGAKERHEIGDDASDLVARRDAAILRLRDISEGNATATAQERHAIELEAARAMRDLEQPHPTAAPTAAKADSASVPSGPSGPSSPAGKGMLAQPWLWAVGSAAFTLAAVLGIQSFSRPRGSGPMTGGDTVAATNAGAATMPMEDHAAQGSFGPEITALEDRVKKEPDNTALRTQLAEAYLEADGGAFLAFQQAKTVLAKQPDNARALTVSAVVRGMMGQHPQAFELADRAVVLDPTLENGWFVRGREAKALGNDAAVQDSVARLEKLNPAAADELREANASTPAADAQPASSAASAPSASAAPAAAPAAGDIQGTIDLDPSLKGQVPAGAFVFVFARDASGSPMPVAAKKLPATGFPISFTLGAADAVMGRPIPPAVTLEARLDADGNAFTKDPTDPVAREEQVQLGRTGLSLVLRRPSL